MKNHRYYLQALLTALILTVTLIPQLKVKAQDQKTSYQAFTDPLDSYNDDLWHKADGWTNGDPFDCGWRKENIDFTSGVMTLTLNDSSCPDGCSGAAYASGEYRTNGFYQYGTYTVEMKAAASKGIVSSFFIYADSPHDEIDIEILGKDPTKMQVNYYTDDDGGHEVMIDLGFDASADFHTYAIEWMPDSIKWFVDGILVHTENESGDPLPSTPGQIMMNLWPGTDSVNAWLGEFTYSAPLKAQYNSVSFEPAEWPNKNYMPLTLR